MNKFDKFDKILIRELDIDSSLSFSYLSKIVNRSIPFVKSRINRLKKLEVINAYQSIMDIVVLGYVIYASVHLKVITSNKAEEDRLLTYFVNNKDVVYVAKFVGTFDLQINLVSKSFEEFNSLLFTVLEPIEKQILDCVILTRLKAVRYSRDYLLEKEPLVRAKSIFYKGLTNISLLKDEKNVLKCLLKNSRLTSSEISRELNLSQPTVYRIIKRLKKNIIGGQTISLNWKKLGYIGYKLLIKTNFLSSLKEKELFSVIEKLPWVLFFTKNQSDWNYELRLEMPSTKELKLVIRELKFVLGNHFKDVEILIFDEELKENWSYILE